MLTSLLVPTDGSPLSERAIPLAAEMARRTGARLHLLAVLDPTDFIPYSSAEARAAALDPAPMQARQAHDHERVESTAASLRAAGIDAHPHTTDGTVVECILEQARELGATLIVMATHGRTGFARMRIGSVATAVLARSAIPVLMVTANADHPEAPATLGNGPLVVPLDGEDFAEAVLPHAIDLAGALGLTLALVAVAAPRATPLAPLAIELLAEDDADVEDTDDVRAYLARVASRCPAGTMTSVITSADIDDAIVQEAERLDAAMIAMASHVRGGLARLLQRSVTDAVVHRASRPVLIHHPGEVASSAGR